MKQNDDYYEKFRILSIVTTAPPYQDFYYSFDF